MTRDTKRVYTVEHFELLDGTEIEVKPLPIKRLRIAQKNINKVINSAKDSDGEDADVEEYDNMLIDALVGVVQMVVKGQEGCEKFNDEDEGRDNLEDVLDQDTMYEIVRVSTGYDFLAMRDRAEKLIQETLTS